MHNPFKAGDIVKAASTDHYSLLSNYGYLVRHVSGGQVAVEGKAGWYPWTDFKKAGEVTPNPNVDSTGAAADGVLVITEGLVFKNMDKIKKIVSNHAAYGLASNSKQRGDALMSFLFEVLAELSKEK